MMHVQRLDMNVEALLSGRTPGAVFEPFFW